MFRHAVLFEIKPQEVKKYHKDNRMWARHAKKCPGFISYSTVKRLGRKNQYVSVYQWKTKSGHDRFMKELHEWLVAQSKARVKVLDYYNLKTIVTVK
jgi:hypothetical protein